jgi:Sulfotransferase family
LPASPQAPKVGTSVKLVRDARAHRIGAHKVTASKTESPETAAVSSPALGSAAQPFGGREVRPILVTGMHRSGTTWLGHMLCAGGSMIHVGEPLNVFNRLTILSSKVGRWYTYIGEDNEDLYLRYYQDAVAFRPHPIQDIRRARLGSPRDPIRIPKRWASFVLGRVQRRRLLIRDPFSVFSIGWFARRLGFQIVVIVRHPLAVVASLKRLGYAFDFRNLLEQTSLMNERLERFRPDMEKAVGSTDIVEQGSLLWRIVYECVAEDLVEFPVCLARHEDLSQRPIQEYAQLYKLLNLPFNDKAHRMIERHTSHQNVKEVSVKNPFEIRLDSRANLVNWRRRLDREEVDRILSATRPLVDRFYPDE